MSNEIDNAAVIPRMPRIDEPAPDFTAKITHGVKSLVAYKGKWLVLFSHPANFTPGRRRFGGACDLSSSTRKG